MNFKKNLKQAIFIGVLSFLIILSLFFHFFKHPSLGISNNTTKSANLSPNDLPNQHKYWIEEITAKGGLQAFKDFKIVVQTLSPNTQHTLSHIFGQSLFEIGDLKNISICDSSFSYGCFHGFFAAAVKANGLNIINQADQACIDKLGAKGFGCQHGIGHGLLEYLGKDKLSNALDICSRLSSPGGIFYCTDGVFMEYDFPASELNGLIRTQTRLVSTDLYQPCDSVQDRYKQSCYYNLPNWWEQVLNKNNQKIGQLCFRINQSDLKDFCYLGIGRAIPPLNKYSVNQSITDCSYIPEEVSNELCRVAAGQDFYSLPQYREESFLLCNGLNSNLTQKCNSDILGLLNF